MINNRNQINTDTIDKNIFIVISDILKKYGIDESPIEAMFMGDESLLKKIFVWSKKIIEKKINEEVLLVELQRANIQTKISKQILEDIKIKIIPMLTAGTSKDKTGEENKDKESINVEKINNEPPKRIIKKSSGPDRYRESID